MSKLWRSEVHPESRPAVLFLCPGCGWPHTVLIAPDGQAVSGGQWEWNGNMNTPTFSPSILCFGTTRCHSFVRNGQIQFLADCDHPLAGKTVELPEFGWTLDVNPPSPA